MRTTLFGKIFLLIFSTITFIFIVFIYQFMKLQEESIFDAQIIKAKSIAQNIIISNSDAMVVDDEITLLESVQDFVKLNSEIKSFTISRKNGMRIVITKDNWNLIDFVDIPNKNIFLEKSYKITTSSILKDEIFLYNYPVYFTHVLWGDFRIELNLNEYKKQLDQLYTNSIYLGVLLFITSFLVSYIIAKMISKPIVNLSAISEEVSNGDLSKRAKIESNDEIGRLSKSFNTMVSSLEVSQKELTDSHNVLEQRVKQRTQELKELNASLEKRVHDEIKARQEQEQILIQQSKLAAMGEMIGNIAHQWRQPLNALGLVMQNIQFSYEMDELDDEFMDRSVKKVNLLTSNMSKTIDDFRNFFKPNKEKEGFVLNSLIEKALALVESTFEHNDIVIEQKLEGEIKVFGFPNEFSQTILNVMNNAKDALIENEISDAKVSISISKDDKYGIVTIIDNAGGIPIDIIDKIFEPYFTTKEEGKGTGIGLYMSKIIVEQNMDGKLYAKNLDNGAEFIVKVPLYEGFNR